MKAQYGHSLHETSRQGSKCRSSRLYGHPGVLCHARAAAGPRIRNEAPGVHNNVAQTLEIVISATG